MTSLTTLDTVRMSHSISLALVVLRAGQGTNLDGFLLHKLKPVLPGRVAHQVHLKVKASGVPCRQRCELNVITLV